MSKQWARQEAKKNELVEAFNKTAAWVQANRQQAMAGVGVALVLALLGAYFAYQHLVVDRSAWRSFGMAQALAYQGQFDRAEEGLQSLSERFGRTPVGGFATLLAGDIRYRQGEYGKAVDNYRKIVNGQGPQNLVPFALSDETLTQEAASDCQSSVESARRFLDQFKDHFLAPQTHAALARCLQAMGRPEEAKVALQQMMTLYPQDQDPYWYGWAQARLQTKP